MNAWPCDDPSTGEVKIRKQADYRVVKRAWSTIYYNTSVTLNGAHKLLQALTGVNSFVEPILVTDEQLRTLELLAGPHGRTLIKAHMAVFSNDNQL